MKRNIYLSLAIAFLLIGMYETYTVGILASYWLFMLSGILLLLIKLSPKRAEGNAPEETASSAGKKKKNKGRLKKK